MFQLVKGFDGSISTNLEIPFFYPFYFFAKSTGWKSISLFPLFARTFVKGFWIFILLLQ
jgi:hypothetical protein